MICDTDIVVCRYNPLRPNDAYMRHHTRPSLVQIMACRLSGAKPLSGPLLAYFLLNPWGYISVQFESKYNNVHWRKRVSKCHLQNGGHFLSRLQCDDMIHHNTLSLQWRHNGCDGVSNHQPHDCLLNYSFRRRSKKTSKLSVTGLCAGNSPVTGEFPTQMASNAENASIWWRHHDSTELPWNSIRRAVAMSGLILGLHPANERRRHKVTPSLIGWVQPWI